MQINYCLKRSLVGAILLIVFGFCFFEMVYVNNLSSKLIEKSGSFGNKDWFFRISFFS